MDINRFHFLVCPSFLSQTGSAINAEGLACYVSSAV
jgi:hypothetical protein